MRSVVSWKGVGHGALLVCVAAAMWGCGEDKPEPPGGSLGDEALINYLQTEFGLTLTGLEETAEFEVEEDGSLFTSAEFTLDVEGLGSRELYLEEYILPASEGGDVILLVEDNESGNSRYFTYNENDNFVLFAQDLNDPDDPEFALRGAAVGRNEDGTYSVFTFDESGAEERFDEQLAEDGFEALRLVEEFNDFNTIEPHVMLAAVALGHTEVPEARTPSSCTNTASRPPICTLFQEFCDCAACSVLGTGTDCNRCPDL